MPPKPAPMTTASRSVEGLSVTRTPSVARPVPCRGPWPPLSCARRRDGCSDLERSGSGQGHAVQVEPPAVLADEAAALVLATGDGVRAELHRALGGQQRAARRG